MNLDAIIIGGGPAGYLAAERIGGLGKSVMLVESQDIGGTCLNSGCIPTKSLLNGAKIYKQALEARQYGVTIAGAEYDWTAMQDWKNDVVQKLRAGIDGMLKRGKVRVVAGHGSLNSGKSVVVTPDTGEEPAEYTCDKILIATGSAPSMPPIPGSRDNPRVVDSTALLEIGEVPESLCVIGGGVIGVEFASLFATLGCRVTVVEMLDEIVPFMDRDQAVQLRRAMRGVSFKLGCRVERIEDGVTHYTTAGGKAESVEADLVLMAVGRRPVVEGWGAERAGVDVSPRGVRVDDRMATNVPGIWAAGDVTGRSLLAHSAYRMAEVAVDNMFPREADAPLGTTMRMRYNAIPWAVYSLPEAAGVGLTEQEAEADGIKINKAIMPMRASGRFVAENGIAGLGAVKIISSAEDNRILGLHAVGPYSSEFIWGGAALIEQEMRVRDLRELILPHPTVGELIRDIAWQMPVI